MAKKFIKRALSVGLSLAMCATMAAPAFAASFRDLNEAISSKENGTFGEKKDIYASTSEDGTRNVRLDGDVIYDAGAKDDKTITIDGSEVVIDLNGKTIDGGYRAADEETGEGAQAGSGKSVITVKDGDLTIKDSTTQKIGVDEDGNDIYELGGGTITGGNALYEGKGGGIYSSDSNLTLDGVRIAGNAANNSGAAVWAGAEKSNDEVRVTMNNVVIESNEAKGTFGGGTVTLNKVANADLTGIVIKNNTVKSGGGGIAFQNCDDVNVTNAKITNNECTGEDYGNPQGGGVYADGTKKISMNNVTVSGNKVHLASSPFLQGTSGYGGGMYLLNCTEVTLGNAKIFDNTADVYGGGMFVQMCGKVVLEDGSVVANNTAKNGGDDVAAFETNMALANAADMNEKLKSDNKPISGWYYDDPGARWITGPYREYEGKTLSPGGSFVFLKAAHDVYYKVTFDLGYEDAENIIKDLENKSEFPVPADPTREGYTFTGWFDEDGNLVNLGDLPETVTKDMTLTAQWEEAEPEPTDPTEPTDPGTEIEDPDVPLGEEPDDIEIEDPEVPLAGPFTRADAIGYLWEQTGSPDAELSDFPDVPEDHYWAVAIGWAQDMGIALPDEEGNFRPDDLVLRSSSEPEGELQQFLNRYAVFAGAAEQGETFIQLTGAWDDVIMGEEAQVIFDDFFAKLEAALAEQAA